MKNYLLCILGLTLISIAVNLFLIPNEIVTGGASGLATIFKDYISPSLFVFIFNAITMLISLKVLGLKKTKKVLFTAIMFPVIIFLTRDIRTFINISDLELIFQIVLASVFIGVGAGMNIRSEFYGAGTPVLAGILKTFIKRSAAEIMFFIDGAIILISAFTFGMYNLMYGVLGLYIITILINRIVLGIGDNKAFYIVTSEEEKIKEFILNNMHHGVSIIKAKGGYKSIRHDMLFCTIPTREYYLLKEGIKKIDPKAFFVIQDAYEVKGGA